MKSLTIDSWKEYLICNLFEVKNTHSILSRDINENSGRHPYVTASEGNNSITTFISYDMSQIEEGNSILIGGKTLVISYQSEDFFSNDSHNLALYLKDASKRNKYIQLYLVTVLKVALSNLYSWGDSISKKSIQKDKITLPSDDNGEPDWSYMESYVSNLEIETSDSFEKLNDTNNNKQSFINTDSWGTFHIYDLFEIDSGNKLDKAKMDTSVEKINFVGRSNYNNGVTQQVNEIDGLKLYERGNLTLALGGSLGSCFVQDIPFYTSQNVVVLIPKIEMSLESKHFIATVIFKESQNNYRAFVKELNRHIKTDFSFKLPINSDKTVNYEYMDSYMNLIKKDIKFFIETI